MNYSGQKFLQNCGDYLIIDKKSSKKQRTRYLWESHFEGYDRILYVRQDSFTKGLVDNPDKPDQYGFICDDTNVDSNIYFVWKNIERRCYYSDCDSYSGYGAKGVTVSEEFKKYSNFKNWYINNYGDPPYGVLDVDKDCKSYLQGLSNKIYSSETCMLIPPIINTYLSSIGKGIYTTKYNTYCVKLRRKFQKENKNFKTLEEAILFKKTKDMEYLNILLDKEDVSEENKTLLKQYVEIFEYGSDFPRNS